MPISHSRRKIRKANGELLICESPTATSNLLPQYACVFNRVMGQGCHDVGWRVTFGTR